MPFKDLRAFLDVLKQNKELIEVDRPVALELEVGKALRKSAAFAGPAILFKNNGTAFPLVGGLYNSRAKALLAFECTEKNIFDYILQGLQHPISPQLITTAAPVQENIILGKDVDLTALPIPKYSPDDGGAYITSGIVVSKDPETGIPDMGNYRFQFIDAQHLSFLAQPNHRFGKHIAKARQLGLKKYTAAIVVGVDPVMAYSCQVQGTDDTNDFEVAGGLRRCAVELVNCKTIDVQVPAHAEFVLEIEVDLTKNVFEGPLGEYTGYYTPGSEKPLATVTAITHRNEAYFQALLTGVPPTENHILKQLPFEASFYQSLKQSFPTISQVAIPPSGGVSFYVVIAMEPRFAGEAKQVLLSAMASNIRPKIVIVVNPDIDVHNSTEVEWAISFRMQPSKNIIIVDNIPATPLDPSLQDDIPMTCRIGSAIGIDATYPFVDSSQPQPNNFKIAEVPGWQDYNFPELDQVK